MSLVKFEILIFFSRWLLQEVTWGAHFRKWLSYYHRYTCVKIWFGLVDNFLSYNSLKFAEMQKLAKKPILIFSQDGYPHWPTSNHFSEKIVTYIMYPHIWSLHTKNEPDWIKIEVSNAENVFFLFFQDGCHRMWLGMPIFESDWAITIGIHV